MMIAVLRWNKAPFYLKINVITYYDYCKRARSSCMEDVLSMWVFIEIFFKQTICSPLKKKNTRIRFLGPLYTFDCELEIHQAITTFL